MTVEAQESAAASAAGAQPRRRYYAAGFILPSGTMVRPEPVGFSGYRFRFGNIVVEGKNEGDFWRKVGKMRRNQAEWASRNKRKPHVPAQMLLDAYAAEDRADECQQAKGW